MLDDASGRDLYFDPGPNPILGCLVSGISMLLIRAEWERGGVSHRFSHPLDLLSSQTLSLSWITRRLF